MTVDEPQLALAEPRPAKALSAAVTPPKRLGSLPQLLAGQTLPGGYRVTHQLGAGGYGAVYAGHDLQLDRPVAVKLLTRASSDEHKSAAQALKRFRDEGRLLAKLQHPNIIQIFASGELEGHAYLVMERFGEGSIEALWPRGERPSLDETIGIIKQLLSALAAAHQAGVIHRDVKEANLLYDPQLRLAKLCDFGIARSLTPLQGQAGPTAEGMIIGTDHYIAPERLVGVHDDPRSDLYSVGVLMYRLLTGLRPFERSLEERPAPQVVMVRALQEQPTLPERLPLKWRRLCLSLLARDPAHRPESAARALELFEDAEVLAETESAPLSLEGVLERRAAERGDPPPRLAPHLANAHTLEAHPARAHTPTQQQARRQLWLRPELWALLGALITALVMGLSKLTETTSLKRRPHRVIKLGEPITPHPLERAPSKQRQMSSALNPSSPLGEASTTPSAQRLSTSKTSPEAVTSPSPSRRGRSTTKTSRGASKRASKPDLKPTSDAESPFVFPTAVGAP